MSNRKIRKQIAQEMWWASAHRSAARHRRTDADHKRAIGDPVAMLYSELAVKAILEAKKCEQKAAELRPWYKIFTRGSK